MVSKLKITSKTYVCVQSLATYTSDTLTSQITATGFVFYLVPLPLLSVTNLPLLFQRLQLYVKILSVMTPAAYDPSVPPKSLVVWFCFFYHFEPVSLSKLAEMITHLKLSVCLPRHYSHSFIQEDTVRPRVLSIIDVCLLKGTCLSPCHLQTCGSAASSLSQKNKNRKTEWVLNFLSCPRCWKKMSNGFNGEKSGFKAHNSTE